VAEKDNSNTTLNSASILQGKRQNENSVRIYPSSAKSTKDASTKSPATTASQSSTDGQSRITNTRNIISETQTTNISEQLKSKMKRDQEISLAVTLVIIAIVFICCQSVKLIADVYELIYCDRPSENSNSTIGMGEYTVLDY
jgi:hypothetical protein